MSSSFEIKGHHLFLQLTYNRELVPIPLGPVKQSLRLFQLLVQLNTKYYETFRGLIRGLKIGRDISQVRVIQGEGGLELWFPQIPYQSFMTTQKWDYSYFHEDNFWMDYVDTTDQHKCSTVDYPQWYFNNIQTSIQISHEYWNRKPETKVVVETALEAWESLPFHSVQIHPYDNEDELRKVLDESYITPEPPRLATKLYLDPEDVTTLCNEGNWLELPYVYEIFFWVDSVRMRQVLSTIRGVYPRVKEITLNVEIIGLEDTLLAKLMVLFPRLDCVKIMFDHEPTPQHIFIKGQRVFGHLWHHSNLIAR